MKASDGQSWEWLSSSPAFSTAKNGNSWKEVKKKRGMDRGREWKEKARGHWEEGGIKERNIVLGLEWSDYF